MTNTQVSSLIESSLYLPSFSQYYAAFKNRNLLQLQKLFILLSKEGFRMQGHSKFHNHINHPQIWILIRC